LLFAGPWHVHEGDDISWADPGTNRSDWPVLDHTGYRVRWDQQPQLAGAETAWFEAPLHVAFRDGQDPAIAVHAVGAWEAFVDGQPVGGDGQIGVAPARWDGPHVLPVPRVLVDDGTLDVAVRIWMPRAYDQAGGALFTLGVGDRSVLETQATSWLRAARLADAPFPFVGSLLVVAGLLHVYVWIQRRELRAYGIFGAAATIFGLVMCWNFLVYDGFLPMTRGVGFFQGLGFGLGGLLVTLFAAVFFGTSTRLPRICLALLVPTLLFGQLTGGAIAVVAAYATILLPAVGYGLYSVATGLRRRVPGGRSIGAGLAIFAILWLLEDLGFHNRVTTEANEPVHIFVLAASVLALAVGVIGGLAVRFAAGLDDLESALDAARQFVPAAFLQRIGRKDIREVRRGDAVEREMTVLFLDVRSFTTLAERRPANEMFRFINELWGAVEPAIVRSGGFVNRFTGDGMLALFDDAQSAVEATVGVSRALDAFDATPFLGERIAVGLGVHTGPMLLGTVGGRDYLAAGVVADAANLGARVEGMTKTYGSRALLSGETVRRLSRPEAFELREIDRVVAKGRAEPVEIYELLDAELPEARRIRRECAPTYASALAQYRAGRFTDALPSFDACVDDPAARAMAERCRTMRNAPDGWDGTWRLSTK
jgi:class 3 adenylate cyclase